MDIIQLLSIIALMLSCISFGISLAVVLHSWISFKHKYQEECDEGNQEGENSHDKR